MAELQVEHTSARDAAVRRAIRQLLDAAFEGDVEDHDYEHALGGMHALVWEGPELIGPGSVVLRRLLHGGRALRTGYRSLAAGSGGGRRLGGMPPFGERGAHAGELDVQLPFDQLNRVVDQCFGLGQRRRRLGMPEPLQARLQVRGYEPKVPEQLSLPFRSRCDW